MTVKTPASVLGSPPRTEHPRDVSLALRMPDGSVQRARVPLDWVRHTQGLLRTAQAGDEHDLSEVPTEVFADQRALGGEEAPTQALPKRSRRRRRTPWRLV